MLWKQCGFLTSSGNKILNGPYVQELFNVILLLASLATFKILGHSKLDSLEARGNHPANIAARNAALKAAKSLSWFEEIFPQMII